MSPPKPKRPLKFVSPFSRKIADKKRIKTLNNEIPSPPPPTDYSSYLESAPISQLIEEQKQRYEVLNALISIPYNT